MAHGYDAIDYGLLWQAVETRVPGLLLTLLGGFDPGFDYFRG